MEKLFPSFRSPGNNLQAKPANEQREVREERFIEKSESEYMYTGRGEATSKRSQSFRVQAGAVHLGRARTAVHRREDSGLSAHCGPFGQRVRDSAPRQHTATCSLVGVGERRASTGTGTGAVTRVLGRFIYGIMLYSRYMEDVVDRVPPHVLTAPTHLHAPAP